MRYLAVTVLIGLVMICVLGACKEEQLSKQTVTTVLDSLEHKLSWLDYRLALERWDYLAAGESDSLEFFEQLYGQVLTDVQNYDLLRRGRTLLTDEIDQRRAELILSRMQVGRIELRPEVVALRQAIGDPMVIGNGGVVGSPLVDSLASGRIAHEDVGRGELYVAPELADAVGRLVRLRNQLARREGFNNYYALSMKSQGLDVDEHLSLVRQLEEASLSRYRQYLDSMALQLGVSALSIRDVSLLIAAEGSSGIWDNFPADSEFILVKQGLATIGFDLNCLPIYFDDTKAGDSATDVQCIAVKPPHDVRIFGYRPGRSGNFEFLLQVGRALHSVHVAADRPLFNSVLSPVWREGVSRVFAYMVDEPAWLEKYAHASGSSIERYRRERTGAEIARLRWTLMHLMFEHQAYTNPDRDLNRLYWEQVEKYMLLPSQDGPDYWALVGDYAARPVQMHNDLYGAIIASQTLAFLDKQYGGLVDNPEAYSFLVQNYMRFGSRYPWQDLLQRGTGENLNSEYYLARLGL